MATQFEVYQETLRLFGDARLEFLVDDTEAKYALDDAWNGAITFCLRAAAWRFALVQADLVTSTPLTPGFTVAYDQPVNWLRTHSLYIGLSDGREHPVDIRQYGTRFFSNHLGVRIRFVSSAFADPQYWSEHFAKALAAYLAFQTADRLTNSAQASVRMAQLYGTLMAEAVAADALREDPWLRYQLDGSFVEGLLYVLGQGFWIFALKTVEFTAAPLTQPPAIPPVIGYPYSYPQPADFLRAHAYFVPAGDGREYPIDIKEDGDRWSTAAPYFAVRFISSTLGSDPTRYPQTFLTALLSYLQLASAPEQPQQASRTTGQPVPAAATFRNVLAAAIEIDGEREDRWYRFLRSGAFLQACFHVAETGRWRFAINTLELTADATLNADRQIEGQLPANVFGPGTISPSYSAVFAKPADWLKTIWVYRVERFVNTNVNIEGWPDRHNVDFRDEGGNWHTNWEHIQVRYVRRAAIESWRWPQSYANAVLAWLEYEEARLDPKLTGIAATKLKIFEDLADKAAKSDDSNEFPPYRHVGHLVRGRYYRSRGVGAHDFIGPR